MQGPRGTPEKVVLDQGREFTSWTTRGLLRDLGVEVKCVSVDNHQKNPVERVHRTLWAMCRSQRVDGERSWRFCREDGPLYLQSVSPHLHRGPPKQGLLGAGPPAPLQPAEDGTAPRHFPGRGPGTVAAQLQDSMSILMEAMEEKQAMMIARNGKYYLYKAMSL